MGDMTDVPLCSVPFDGVVPLHFYGELVKTTEGRMILDAKGHFIEFVDMIRTHGLEDSDSEILAKLKSVLWAVVSFASTSDP
jgi:rapamycin-insensitive companion of mTOR